MHNVVSWWLHFMTDAAAAAAFITLQLITRGLRADEYASTGLQYVPAAEDTMGRHMNDYKIMINKSTSPLGTADKVQAKLVGY